MTGPPKALEGVGSSDTPEQITRAAVEANRPPEDERKTIAEEHRRASLRAKVKA